MITGYNTDVRYNDVVYHVQTEDKGLSNPFIESLLYVGGQILANKRTSYAELLADGKGERAVVALMDHQHRTMIAAIRAGKFDRKMASLRGEAELPVNGEAAAEAPLTVPPPLDGAPPLEAASAIEIAPLVEAAEQTVSAAAAPTLATVATADDRGAVVAASAPPPVPRAASRPEPAPATPPPAVDRTLDQVILDYLTVESQQDQLTLAIENDTELGLGRQVRLTVRASSSRSAQPLAGVHVTAKLISTVAGPLSLASGESDETGTTVLELEIPVLGRGTAALIVTGSSPLGRAEYKHLL